MQSIKIFSLALVFCLGVHSLSTAQTGPSSHPALPSAVIPEGLGVNIHFITPRPGELKMLVDAGFRWVRMDFNWGTIEQQKGVYDFRMYDSLVASLNKYHLKAVFILDYGNALYDNAASPHSPEAVAAFAKWAAASALHFASHDILWEMWNEPNNNAFWDPKLGVKAYIQLALAAGKAIKVAAPEEAFLGPATYGIPLDFLEACFKAGLLQYWDAVSLHPYRQGGPETVSKDCQAVRQLIAKYAPAGKSIPLISGEWGYSAAWKDFTLEKQGIMLARELLTNLSNDISLSIWYDWNDDGIDQKNGEYHFGTASYTYHVGRDPVYDPKPAYLAAKALTNTLNGYHFYKRLPSGSPDDYILLFSNKKKVRLAAWTIGEPHTIVLAAGKGRFAITDYQGHTLPKLKADQNGLAISLTDAPRYLIPLSRNNSQWR